MCICVTLSKQFTLVSVFLSVKWRSGLPRWLRIHLPSRRCGCKSWVRKIPEQGNGNTLQHFCLGIPMNRGDGRVTVHGVVKSKIQLRDQQQQQENDHQRSPDAYMGCSKNQ